MLKKSFFAIFLLLFLVNSVIALDVAYVVRNPASLDSNELTIRNFLNTEGYDVTVLDDSIFNANDYNIIIVSEGVSDINDIFDNKIHKTLFLSNAAAKNAGLSISSGVTSGRNTYIIGGHEITDGFSTGIYDIYSTQDNIDYIFGCKATNADNLAYRSDLSRSVLLALDTDSFLINGSCSKKDIPLFERNLFFGLTESVNWNLNAEDLFRKSLIWLSESEDNDGDGYNNNVDCDDYDDKVYPGAEEILYDGIDQDCDGIDPVDVDGDGYDAEEVGGDDCNDNDANVYPGNPDESKDCTGIAPTIDSFNPLYYSLSVLKNQNREFSVSYSDEDSNPDDLFVEWEIDGVIVDTGDNFIFNKNTGNYVVRAIVNDEVSSVDNEWYVIVESSVSFTCDDASGYICSGNQACEGDILEASDSDTCCSTECTGLIIDFEGINNLCENNDEDIDIFFQDISSNEEFDIKETLISGVRIWNNFDENLNYDITSYLYDLTEGKVINKQKESSRIRENNYIEKYFEHEIEEDLDEGNEYAILVVVENEDNKCNQKYVKINVVRPDHLLSLEGFNIIGNYFVCGDSIRANVEIKNLGFNEESFYITFKNSELGINKKTDALDVEGNGNDDVLTKEFTLDISEKAQKGEYTLTADVFYNNKKTTLTKKVVLTECKTSSVEEQSLGETKSLGVVSEINDPEGLDFKTILSISFVVLLIAVSLFLLFHIFSRR